MSFARSKQHKLLPTSDRILNCITDLDIFQYYLGGIPRKAISSPLREDTNPSFSLFHSEVYNKTFFKDFGTGESGDCFLFVMRLFNLRTKIEVFNKIASDFGLDQFEINSSHNTLSRQTFVSKPNRENTLKTTKVRISVRVRDWELKDALYWKDKYGLSKAQLEYCKIFPISHFFINGFCTQAIDIAYAFVEEKDGIQTFKIYQPYADKDDKWINNNDYSVWELWTQMPDKGETLIITSSRKDAAVIKSLFPSKKITSCSLQSEGVHAKKSVVKELKERFKNIFVLYDNDFNNEVNRGRVSGEKICSETGFTQIEIPDGYLVKDPSDYRNKFGGKATRELILKLIKKN